MLQEITFAADKILIEQALAAAHADNTTLDEQFGVWLEQYIRAHRARLALRNVERLSQYARTEGRRFTRADMNDL